MKRILKSFSFVLLLLFLMVPKTNANFDPTEGKSFDVHMEVDDEGVVKVNTTLAVNFKEPRQGIFVSLPTLYTDYNFSSFTGNDKDDNLTYYFPVKNFRSLTHEYELDNSSDEGAVYRLGTAGVYLEGIEVFEYAYEIHTKDLGLTTNDQLFLMNLIGERWDYDFDKIDFEIVFDKSIEDSPVMFELSDGTEITDFEKSDHKITGSYEGSIGQGQALTILVDLPDDYFSFKNLDISYLATIVAGLFAIVMTVWKKTVDDHHELIDYIEWNPPKGFNSADVGYVSRGGLSSDKDIVSLIIYWADQGYLKLEEKDKKTTILHKVKDIDPNVKDYEKRLFEELFYKREKVSTKSLNQSFYTHFNAAKNNLSYYFKGENALFDGKSIAVTVVGSILGMLVFAFIGTILNYGRFGEIRFINIETIIFAPAVLALVVIGSALRTSSLRDLKKWRIKDIFLIIGSVIMVIYVYGVSSEFNLNKVFILSSIIMAVYGIYISTQAIQYTYNGNDWTGQILGMQDFIETVELEALEQMVEEEPYLFYNILPFAYVLGLSNRWIKKFETIAIPPSNWYVSPMYYHPRIYRNLNSTMNNLNSSMASAPPAQKSSGGGFSGGGGSSGGGFGGGGFGGGGGGSW